MVWNWVPIVLTCGTGSSFLWHLQCGILLGWGMAYSPRWWAVHHRISCNILPTVSGWVEPCRLREH